MAAMKYQIVFLGTPWNEESIYKTIGLYTGVEIVDVDDVEFGMADIEIECYLSKVESLVVIFKVFDIYIDMVDYMDYHY